MPDADLYQCPAEGCDYGPLPISSVASHYSGKKDAAHAGGYNDAMYLLGQQGPVERSEQGDTEPPTETSADAGTVEFPHAPETSTSGQSDGAGGDVCPDCGGDLLVFDGLEEVQCDDCGAWWVPEEPPEVDS